LDEPRGFGELLRAHRVAAGLTQEALAASANLSVRGIADLERGTRRYPYVETLRRLSHSLALTPSQHDELVAAGRRPIRIDTQSRPLSARAPGIALSLPAELTSFIGREGLLAEVGQLLSPAAPTCRLVTLTGPGGTGKTRVALRAAAAVRDQFEDGAFFVELAPISDARLVASTIAQTLGIPDAGSQAPLERLKSYVGHQQLLLVLDNFEQLLGAAPQLAELLAATPRLKLLVTSRAALRVSGEREVTVAPLTLPQSGRLDGATSYVSPRAAGECESVRLFVERARAVNAAFALNADTSPAVSQICVRLDGLPLAIELAAARIRLLDAPALLARLEHRLPLLTEGARDLPARQQTLRNTIAWSYDLLEPAEQALCRLVAVFVGGCTLEAAQAVSLSDDDVLDHADSLVAKSLVRAIVDSPGQARLTMLETTREFGLEQLAATDELEILRRRHAEYYMALAEQAEPELWGPSASAWLDRLAAEHDNMRAALEWALTDDGPIGGPIALRLAGALARYWWTRSYLMEGQHWLARALASTPGRSAAHMKALHGAGWLAHFRRDSGTARALLEESLAIARELDDRWTVAWVLHGLGRVAYFDGDQDAAGALGEQSLAVADTLGDRWLIAWALHLLGLAAHIGGDYGRADAYYERSLAIRLDLGHHEAVGILYQLMGISAHHQGRFLQARECCQEFLEMSQELGSPWHLSNALAQFASLAAAQQQPERAARLIGAAALVNETFRTRPIPLMEDLFVEAVGVARQALGEAAFAVAMARGKAMTPEEARAEALAVEVVPPGASTNSVQRRQNRENALERLITVRELALAAAVRGSARGPGN